MRTFLITALVAGFSAVAADWPQFRGNPRLTGVAQTAPAANLKLLWTFEGGDAFLSSAAIVGGVVYVGGENGELFAVDLASGKLRWKTKLGESIGESSPAVAE